MFSGEEMRTIEHALSAWIDFQEDELKRARLTLVKLLAVLEEEQDDD